MSLCESEGLYFYVATVLYLNATVLPTLFCPTVLPSCERGITVTIERSFWYLFISAQRRWANKRRRWLEVNVPSAPTSIGDIIICVRATSSRMRYKNTLFMKDWWKYNLIFLQIHARTPLERVYRIVTLHHEKFFRDTIFNILCNIIYVSAYYT